VTPDERCAEIRGLRCRHWTRTLPIAALGLILLGAAINLGSAQAAHTTRLMRAEQARAGDHVYLLRGAFNIFSLGMDQIAARLQRLGVRTTVANYLFWEQLAEQAAAEYRAGRVRTIIFVGHSSGAVAVASMAAQLGQYGVPVKLVIGLDPTSLTVAGGRVGRYINYYVGNGLGEPVIRGAQFGGALENLDVEKNPSIGHFNIDKYTALQEQVIREIRGAL
jgi:hypothetical protein